MQFTFGIPTKMLFGIGRIKELHTEINTCNGSVQGKKAMVIISNGKTAHVSNALELVLEELKLVGVEYVVYDRIYENPDTHIIDDGGKFAVENKCDFLVAIGGGAVIDTAKGIGILATNGGTVWDYIQAGTGGKAVPQNACLPIVSIPTTAGTGSETDPGGAISRYETNEKVGVRGKGTFPVCSIMDPSLMVTVPAHYKAYQGFDALFQSVEGMISNRKNDMSLMIAREAIRSVSAYLAETIRNPDNLEAMEKVAFGSYLSGLQMCVGSCSSAHAIEHALSGRYSNLPHGAGLILISQAYYSYWIEKHVCDEVFIEMARLMGNLDAKQPEDYLDALKHLQTECGVGDLKMSDYGICPETFEEIVKVARDSMWIQFACDPAQMTDEDCLGILQKSYN